MRRRIVAMAFRECARLVEWLGLIARIHETEFAKSVGYRSTADLLAIECRMASRTTRDYVRVAQRLEVWTLVRDALGEGRLSYSQCRALARASVEEDEAALLREAMVSSTNRLERHVRALRSAPAADVGVANEERKRRGLNWALEESGMWRFWGRFPAEDGAALAEAAQTGAERIHAPRDGEGPRPGLLARRADALAEIVRSGCPRTTVMLHADLESLACTATGDEPRAGRVLAFRDGRPFRPSSRAG